jgi:hypothetical protein
VCSALGTAHDEGVVHRDLKPENIFLAHTRAGSEIVKVLDFGISPHRAEPGRSPPHGDELRDRDASLHEPRADARRALRRRQERPVLARCDALQCLTGALPFDGDSFLEILEKMANKKIVPPSQLRDEIPSGLELIVMRTLAKGPEEALRLDARAGLGAPSVRLRAWAPLVGAGLRAAGAAAPREAHTLVLERDTTVKLRSDSGRSRNALAAAIVALLVLGAGTFGVVAWWLRPETPDVTVSPLPPERAAHGDDHAAEHDRGRDARDRDARGRGRARGARAPRSRTTCRSRLRR